MPASLKSVISKTWRNTKYLLVLNAIAQGFGFFAISVDLDLIGTVMFSFAAIIVLRIGALSENSRRAIKTFFLSAIPLPASVGFLFMFLTFAAFIFSGKLSVFSVQHFGILSTTVAAFAAASIVTIAPIYFGSLVFARASKRLAHRR